MKWWEKSEDWIVAHADQFQRVEQFLELRNE